MCLCRRSDLEFGHEDSAFAELRRVRISGIRVSVYGLGPGFGSRVWLVCFRGATFEVVVCSIETCVFAEWNRWIWIPGVDSPFVGVGDSCDFCIILCTLCTFGYY